MNVILLERIENLGQMGDIVRVRDGYARNYLLPQKKAQRATKENMAHFERRRADLEAVNQEHRTIAQGIAASLDGTRIVLIRQAGETGQLYGSVSPKDVADGLVEAGFDVNRKQVQIDTRIKTLGLFDVRVVLHPEVICTVSVNVARSVDEAEMQERRGGMITADEAAEEALEDELFGDEDAEAEDGLDAGETAGSGESDEEDRSASTPA